MDLAGKLVHTSSKLHFTVAEQFLRMTQSIFEHLSPNSSTLVSFKCVAEELLWKCGFQLHLRSDTADFFLTSCRVSQKQRPRPPEVLLPAHQDPDIHPLHWGVHLRQRQRHRPCLLWRLRREGDYQPSVGPVSVIHMVPNTGVTLFCFPLSPHGSFHERAFVLCCFIGKITSVRWESKEAKISSDSFCSLCSPSSSYSFFPLIKSPTRAPR